jgi:capsular exopolysaccharide synthesis family protein
MGVITRLRFSGGLLKSQLKAKLAIPGLIGDAAETGARPNVAGVREPRIQSGPSFPLVLDNNHVEARESFSILRSRLLNVHKKLGTRSVLITSPEAGDGKTLVATNIALSLAQLGSKRILLVDGDLRVAATTKIFDLKQLPGVADFLQRKNWPLDAVLYPTGFPVLSVAPAGLVPSQALPTILEGNRWREFLEEAKEKFDLIIVDSPPASVPVADLEILAMPCDAFLLVVHVRKTHKDALRRVGSRFDMKKLLGVILNNADAIYNYDYGNYDLRPKRKVKE